MENIIASFFVEFSNNCGSGILKGTYSVLNK
jgi:hypothetical protein